MSERKPKKQNVIFVKVSKYEGIDTYAVIDAAGATVLGGRKSFEAAIPVSGRSLNQNALWAVWYNQIAIESGQSPIDTKYECKLNHGVPILCKQDEGFKRMWQKLFEPLSYEMQLSAMKHIGVTRELSKMNGSIYTETLQREFAESNIVLEVL